jgi:eukaryotic-like serine/threonine-protein kinase
MKMTSARTALFGPYTLDLRSGELRKFGTKVKMGEQTFQILRVLLESQGELVTREELRVKLWAGDTFVDFDHGLNSAVQRLRDCLSDSAEKPRWIETIPRRGYRFVGQVQWQQDDETTPETKSGSFPTAGATGVTSRREDTPLARSWWIAVSVALVASASVLALASLWHSRQTHRVTVKNAIVLGDYANSTGDPVFNGTLREGLSVQLSQSPFLRLVSEEAIHQTLQMMGQKPDAPLSPEITREVCQRTNSTVALNGSIALIGNQYDLVLKAIDCGSGDLLAGAKIHANNRNDVLDALDKLASQMRSNLGESLASLRKYNTPLSQATTSSLEALQSYSLGNQTEYESGDFAGSVPWFQRAIAIDPNFAIAYLALSDAYSTLGETTSQVVYMQKAFDLRDGVSEREKLVIEGDYYLYVTGDIVKAQRSFELVAGLYTDCDYAHNLLAAFHNWFGQYDAALGEYQQALRLSPLNTVLHRDVVLAYLLLDRVGDADAAAKQAISQGVGSNLPPVLYSIAFYRNDNAEMARQAASASGKPGEEDMLLALEADTAAYFGRLQEARELSRRAADSAEQTGQEETAATYYGVSALREALFGNIHKALEQAAIAKKRAVGRDMDYAVALALAYAGHEKQARALTDELGRRLPEDTVLNVNYMPTLRARLALNSSNSREALEILKLAAPYELGLGSYSYYNWPNLYPVYVRGEAYLAAQQGDKAAAEFQKILDHRWIVLNEPIGALANLQIGRAYALAGDRAKARTAYQDFLDLWKDADSDIPILKQAKAEYAKLQ